MQALISGFTFVKDALTLGYPIKESIESLEPLCDQIVITVGHDDPELENKDDGTYEFLRDHFKHKKFLFQKSFWDPQIKKEGLILSQQSNYSLRECRGKYCLYLQSDEVLHEKDLPLIHDSVISMEKEENLEALVFNFRHFFARPDVELHSLSIPRKEVRLIRNRLGIKSWQNGQGFRNKDGKALRSKSIPAEIFHYHYLSPESSIQKRLESEFKFEHIWGLRSYEGTHPFSMKNWIDANKNEIDVLKLPPKHQLKNIVPIISDCFERLTGIRAGEYKQFKLIDSN